MEPPRKLISIVTPCYMEQDNVEICYTTVRKIFEEQLPDYDYEHIFCDNASKDRTEEILRTLAAQDTRVKVILNARNFGPFRSLFNGVMAAGGDAVVLFLPADLQDPPEVIPEMVKHWQEGYQVVYGIRANREESAPMRFIRRRYYRLVKRWAEVDIPVDVGEFQLVDRQVVDALHQFEDYYPYLRGMVASCGFKSIGIPYTWRARARGFSKNRMYHLIDQGLNGLISFTNVPLRLCLSVGLILAGLSLLYAVGSVVITAVDYLAFHRKLAEPGIPTLIAALFFFAGVQLFFIGVLGEYIGAIHSQVRKRPLVIEKERLNLAPLVFPPRVSAGGGGAGQPRVIVRRF
jgi:glycosyltransferase involved in cell wall biosynthesis